MIWGVKGPGREAGKPGSPDAGKTGSPDPRIPGTPDPRIPGSREAGEAGKPGSPEAGKPGSREAEARSWISRGGGRFPKDTQMSPRGGEASKYLRVRGALPGGVTQHLRAHAQHTCCVTPPGSAPRTPKNTFSLRESCCREKCGMWRTFSGKL